MIGLLHGVNPVPRLAVPVTRSGELRVGVENWVTVAGLSLVLPQAPEGAIVVVKNCTTSAQVVSASSQITGVSPSGAAIPATNRVRILPGQVGSFLRGDRGWIAQGCERLPLTFTYSGTPLANNNSNPLGAGGVVHYLGGVGTFINPATNGILQSTQSGAAAATATILSDRVTNPTTTSLVWQAPNAANSWVAWQFPARLSPTGFLLQNNGIANAYHVRAFELRYSDDLSAGLSPSSPVSLWTQGPGWTNQVQITGAGGWHYFGELSLPFARRWALRMVGLDSEGTNQQRLAEVEWFGFYEG